MFNPASRERLKEQLIAQAQTEDRVVAAALLGSSSSGAEDQWSDIDLALSIEADQVDETVRDWTARMYEDHAAVHHLDVRWNTTLYRVFLLACTLQVDLSFWRRQEFVAAGPQFRLLFGDPPRRYTPDQQSTEAIIGEAWLYLLHARSAIARGRRWQANHMISGVRDRVLQLACHRHHLSTDDAREVDQLPAILLDRYAATVPADLQEPTLRHALHTVTTALISEARESAPDLAERITDTLHTIAAITSTSE